MVFCIDLQDSSKFKSSVENFISNMTTQNLKEQRPILAAVQQKVPKKPVNKSKDPPLPYICYPKVLTLVSKA